MQEESILKNVKKRRGSYLSYLSNPLLEVPRRSKHRQKLSKEDWASFEDKASGNSCQTIDSNHGDYQDSSDQRGNINFVWKIVEVSIYLKGFCRKKRPRLMPRTIWQMDLR